MKRREKPPFPLWKTGWPGPMETLGSLLKALGPVWNMCRADGVYGLNRGTRTFATGFTPEGLVFDFVHRAESDREGLLPDSLAGVSSADELLVRLAAFS